jgi:hypothetical protein
MLFFRGHINIARLGWYLRAFGLPVPLDRLVEETAVNGMIDFEQLSALMKEANSASSQSQSSSRSRSKDHPTRGFQLNVPEKQ